MDRKLPGWKANALSLGGRLTLLNASLSATPTYFLSFFKAPDWVIKKMDRIRRSFFWAGSAIKVSWRVVCSPRNVGGLGVRDLRSFNYALLAKWWWIRASCPESRIARVLQTKYGARNGVLFGVDRRNFNISAFYRGLRAVKNLAWFGLFFSFGCGRSVSFWGDRWCGNAPLNVIFPALASKTPNASISVRASRRGNRWWIRLDGPLTSTERRDKVALRSLIHNTSFCGGTDRVSWRLTSSAVFSVNSLYTLLNDRGLSCKAAVVL